LFIDQYDIITTRDERQRALQMVVMTGGFTFEKGKVMMVEGFPKV